MPAAAEARVVNMRTLVAVVDAGENDAATPLGSQDTAKLTAPVNPP